LIPDLVGTICISNIDRTAQRPDLPLKLFFASDVHGSDVCWKKFLKVIDHFKTDIAILGGDLTGKMVIPLVEEGAEYSYSLFGKENRIPADQLEAEIAMISNAGYYPFPCNKEEVQGLTGDTKAQEDIFNKLMVERMDNWLNLASEKFKGERKLYVSPGNDDRFVIDEALKKSDSVVACEGELVDLPDGYSMVTSGWVNPTPWKTSRELPDEKLETLLEGIMSQTNEYKKLFCNFHAPPYNSGLDTAPKVNPDMSVKFRFGGIEFDRMGSKAVRKIIEKYKPLLGLHGHIHESAGFRRIGRTLCVNAGSEYAEGVLRGYLIFLSGEKVEGHWRVAS
jgi:Icc-related predicted phosphoesterase